MMNNDRIVAIEPHDRWLRVFFSPERPRHADFHWFWLRHQCSADRHPITSERLLDASEVPLEIQPRDVRIDEHHRNVLVTWNEDSGRQSTYDVEWLRAHAYAPEREAMPPPPSHADRVSLDAQRFPKLETLVAAVIHLARTEGLAIVRGLSGLSNQAPEDDTEGLIAAFSEKDLAIVGTHFGRIEDLRVDNTTNQNTDQLGYTDVHIDVHTDQPFLDKPPRYQLLQCIRAADEGGDNFLCDARAAARYLESLDASAFEQIRTTSVRFHRKQKAFERIVDAPLFIFDDRDGFIARYSYFTLAPFNVPFAQMEAWYRAYDRYAQIVRDPRHQYRFRLEPGEFILYDNHRMLHGRTAFKGSRWLRGIYFDEAQ